MQWSRWYCWKWRLQRHQSQRWMSEGLAWALSARWSRGAHVSEIGKAHFQLGAVFINKQQIWVLNDYILAWNSNKRVQCRNQSNLCVRSQALLLLVFSPALESWSDIYTGPTSCLILPQMFFSFVFYPPLSFCCLARLYLLHIMSRHAPYCWLATSLFWYSARLSFLQRFWKITYPAFNNIFENAN